MGKRNKVTTRDIAEYAGVSQSTVSMILSEKKNVSFVVPGNFPTALLVCELIPGVLDGKKWMYIASTAADCCEDAAAVEAFDQTFPPKEKAWQPSQEEFYIYSHSSVVR